MKVKSFNIQSIVLEFVYIYYIHITSNINSRAECDFQHYLFFLRYWIQLGGKPERAHSMKWDGKFTHAHIKMKAT